MKHYFNFLLFLVLLSYNSYSIEIKEKIIGYSYGKKPINMFQFGNGKQVIIIFSGFYGNSKDENVHVNLLINSLKNESSLSNKSFWIIPEFNPDGIGSGDRTNANNVDISRNFLTENWKPVSVHYNKLVSAGVQPLDQPEATVVNKLIYEAKKSHDSIICITLQEGVDAVVSGDNSEYNKRLVDILAKRYNFSIIGLSFNNQGKMIRWLSEKHGVASVGLFFENKNDNKNIINIINNLIKVDLKKKVYNSSLLDLFTSGTEESLSGIIDHLPDSVNKKVKKSKDSEDEFIKLFKELYSQEELLLLVNKKYYLDNTYAPDDLFYVKDYFTTNKPQGQLSKIIFNELTELFSAAKKNNINLSVISAYRSYDVQKRVYNKWVGVLGEKEAKRVSAFPGASQHQLGTTIDFNMLNEKFSETQEGMWLFNNSYKYGFILSYPKGMEEVTGYKYEPWHYRFIGKEASMLVYKYFDNNLELFLNWYWDNKLD